MCPNNGTAGLLVDQKVSGGSGRQWAASADSARSAVLPALCVPLICVCAYVCVCALWWCAARGARRGARTATFACRWGSTRAESQTLSAKPSREAWRQTQKTLKWTNNTSNATGFFASLFFAISFVQRSLRIWQFVPNFFLSFDLSGHDRRISQTARLGCPCLSIGHTLTMHCIDHILKKLGNVNSL